MKCTGTLKLFVYFFLTLTAFSQEPSSLEKIRQRLNQQGGTLTGKVVDQSSGEDIIGANILFVNTKIGSTTDIDGTFHIQNIPVDTYAVRIAFLGYETKIVSDVVIRTNEITSLNISLNEDQGIQQQEVVVSANIIASGEGAVLAERKKASSIGDGISSEQMKKAPDATSGDALKRVTGISLVDNKFVFVRGVTDRYNQTTLNGASVPSTSVDKKSFSFDMLPSNLLDNIRVAKTASPDLPGDFTGGLVQINTLDIPEHLSIKVMAGGAANSLTTFKDFQRSQGGTTDWLGSDNGARSYPSQQVTLSELGKILPNSWASSRKKGPMAQSFSVSLGDRIDFDEDQLGIIAALTYRNNFQHSGIGIKEYGGGQLRRNVSGYSDKMSVLWGAIFDVSYTMGEFNKVSVKNNYNRSAEDKVYVMSGYKADDDENIRSYQTEWEQRGMYSGQLSGEHQLPNLFDTKIEWMANFSQARTEQPDRKELVYSASPYSDQPMAAKPGERSWGNIYEKTVGQKFNTTIPVEGIKYKFGAYNERRTKNFGMKFYQVSSSSLSPQYFALTTYGVDSIYRQENFGPGKFSLTSFDNSSGAYTAGQDLFAYFGMIDMPFTLFGEQFRFTGGVRVEQSRQEISTDQGRLGSSTITSYLYNSDILPSANITYMLNDQQNIRIAYSQTVNRPEFRERSAFYFYDFDKSEYVRGNAQLSRALIRNYDVRYEIFPSFGDVIAASYFYKSLTNPIEEARTYTSFMERTWINAEKGKNYGWEFEVRKNLAFLGEYFMPSSVVANYTRIISTIPFRENKGNSVLQQIVEGERPMQGQSPYMYNISLSFVEPTLGTSVNILYNEYGSRIDAIGDVKAGDGDVYEQKRGTVDLSISQPLGMLMQGLEWKFAAKNLNNQAIVYTQGKDVYRTNIVGVNYSMQMSYVF
ncbi:MAG: TonB-dependent receptor [Bacteroidota bacterium]